MNKKIIFLFSLLILFACKKETRKDNTSLLPIVENCGTDSALATCLKPKFAPEYYIEQGVKYFQTMQSDIPINIKPNYSDLVIRWEWYPWLKLTGFKKDGLISSDILLKLKPTAYDTIDCKYFDKQPFCRCHVVFDYSGEKCPIYEEFVFNDQGEMTFIEAWSDYPSLIPMKKTDYWAEGENIKRLSTKVPGLGSNTGKINIGATWMKSAAEKDRDIADLVKRCKDPIGTYIDELSKNKAWQNGCEKPEGDEYPYYTE